MPKIKSIVLGAAASLGMMIGAAFAAETKETAPATQEGQFFVPGLAEAVVSNTINLMRSKDEAVNALAKAYVNAFAVTLDAKCDFLTSESRARVYLLVEADFVKKSGLASDFLAAMRLGTHDAKIIGESGCTNSEAVGAMVTLAQNLR